MIEFRVLGPLEVVRDGQALALGSMKQRTLLAIFVLNANELLTRERPIDALWGEQAPPSASSSAPRTTDRTRN